VQILGTATGPDFTVVAEVPVAPPNSHQVFAGGAFLAIRNHHRPTS
jgi:hypothetical protein